MSPGLGVEATGNIPSGLAIPRPLWLLLVGWHLLVAYAIWIDHGILAVAIGPAQLHTGAHI